MESENHWSNQGNVIDHDTRIDTVEDLYYVLKEMNKLPYYCEKSGTWRLRDLNTQKNPKPSGGSNRTIPKRKRKKRRKNR